LYLLKSSSNDIFSCAASKFAAIDEFIDEEISSFLLPPLELGLDARLSTWLPLCNSVVYTIRVGRV
jgi:hypothetical protein